MKREVYLYEDNSWDDGFDTSLDSQNTLIVCFGSTDTDDISSALNDLKNNFPSSIIMGCSTSGEIYDEEIYEHSLVAAVMKFEKTTIKYESIEIKEPSDSLESGALLAGKLSQDDLKALFVLSDGLNVNGSQLTKGLNSKLSDVIVTGGLAGDDANFEKTWVLVDKTPQSNHITAVGFYGEDIHVAYGSQGGWNKFGIDRMVTEARDNVLYKLDDKPALEVYKTYLGEKASELPSSGLLYPLMIKEDGSNESKVRTILAVNEEEQSITFAGDIPNGSEVMFMRASMNELVEGASNAAGALKLNDYNNQDSISIAISCVGRKLVLGHKTEDELEAVMDKLNDNVEQIGYYSYGEISPLNDGKCDLHNQTMTLTQIWES